MEKIILIFIDGVGIGTKDLLRNPVLNLFTDVSPGLQLFQEAFPYDFPGGVALALDACLGIPGIPQSATGQTSLYTGENAQALLGYHLNAMPNEPLIRLLQEKSLPVVLKQAGVISVNANLHSSEYFRMRRGGHRNRFPVSTIMTFAGKIPFLFEKDYREGKGVFMDITGELMRARGVAIPLITPSEAAARLCDLTDMADFVYFEYFLTDRWGHKRERETLRRCLDDLIPFLGELGGTAASRNIHLMVVSDHGNAEDFETGDHTRNPVPFLYCPPQGKSIERDLLPRSLTGVYDLIQKIYNTETIHL